ncbi:MAG: hypothetical protein LBN71_06920, partial [Tannerella sp.]|nr:hypothetical protein [Tannerella sp.]
TCINKSTEAYLWNFFHYAKEKEINEKRTIGYPFKFLIDYGIEKGMFDDSFVENREEFYKKNGKYLHDKVDFNLL